jgi:hypothetical protein
MNETIGVGRASREVMAAFRSAIWKLVVNWPSVLCLWLLYLGWMGTLYLFLTTREATMGQVMLGLIVTPLLGIWLFFLLQALGLSVTRLGLGLIEKWKRAWRESGKIAMVTFPLVALAVGLVLGIEQIGAWLVEQQLGGAGALRRWVLGVWDWSQTFLLFFFFPLWSLHCWLAVVRRGVGSSVGEMGRIFLEAFAPGSVLIYFLTTSLFGGLAWGLLFTRPTIEGVWLELSLFVLRVGGALLVIFLGWLLLLGTMGEWTAKRDLANLD